MITHIEVDYSTRKKVQDDLKKSGYISATALYNSRCQDVSGIKKEWLPSPAALRLLADNPNPYFLSCRILVYSSIKTSSWYNIEDLHANFNPERENRNRKIGVLPKDENGEKAVDKPCEDAVKEKNVFEMEQEPSPLKKGFFARLVAIFKK
jgi:hypothetical protein